MNHAIINREFRDYTAEAKYPFLDSATLINDQGVEIRPNVFLDALIYSVEDRELPFYISELNGTIGDLGEMTVVIKDNNNKEVCTGVINTGYDTCYMYDSFNRITGSLVYDQDHMDQLIGRVGILSYTFSKTQAPFLAERCFVTRVKGLSVIKAGSSVFSNNISIVGANGITFSLAGDEISMNMLGEEIPETGNDEEAEATSGRPIKTINGVEIKNVWLAAHPNSAIKVETNGSAIKIWNINDAS